MRFYRSILAAGLALVAALTAVFAASAPAQASVEQYRRYKTVLCGDSYFRAEFWINRDTATGSRQPYRFAVVRIDGTRTVYELHAVAKRGTTETSWGDISLSNPVPDVSVYFSPRVWYPAQSMTASATWEVARYGDTGKVTCASGAINAYP